MDVAVTRNDTWEWCGVVVFVIGDTWDANVLALFMQMLSKKSCDGHYVGLIIFEPDQEIGFLVWTKQLRAVHSFVSFDRIVNNMKTVSLRMFVCAVKFGFTSKSKLCENFERLHGALLYQAVDLCRGFGLVDEDIEGLSGAYVVLSTVVC